jgi:hypothetical protein
MVRARALDTFYRNLRQNLATRLAAQGVRTGSEARASRIGVGGLRSTSVCAVLWPARGSDSGLVTCAAFKAVRLRADPRSGGFDSHPLPPTDVVSAAPYLAAGSRADSSEDALDIIAHGLSTAAAVVAVRRKSHQQIPLPWAVLFGVFPDLVPFTIPACLRIWWRLTGASRTLLPSANGPHFEWVGDVYNCTHSLLVFAVSFSILWLVMRRPIVAMLGWLLHILLDSFGHRGMFAIQFLWPASSFHVDGIPWDTEWFLAATYGGLMAVCFLLWRSRGLSKVRPSADRHEGHTV